jgi:hypothetical protein
MDVRRFQPSQDGESENGRVTRSPKLALIGESALSLGYFWAPSKKSDSPTAKAFQRRRQV